MRLASVLSTAALLGVSVVAAGEETKASDVIELNAESFGPFVKNEPGPALIEFFAPWCGHCKALAPHYEEAATSLKEKGIKLAKVDCTENADVCTENGVSGYPTLKVFRNGEASDYNGPRKTDGIVSYMVKQSLPAVTHVTSEEHDEFKISDQVVLVAYLPSTTDAPAAAFSAVAEKHRDDYLFGIATDPELAQAAGVTPPAVVLYKKFDEGRADFPVKGIQSTEPEAFTKWINEHSMPLLDEISGENYPSYDASGLPLAWLFLDPASADKDALIEAIKPVAKKHKGVINFVWIDTAKFPEHYKVLNIKSNQWPQFAIQDMKKELKYPLEDVPSFATVGAWADQFAAGKLHPSLKSEPVPETQEGPVHVLVGRSYPGAIADLSKDVVVEYYAPWCGHCKRLAPTWDELGEHYASIQDKIMIAKIDATENDLPPDSPFKIEGFPTIKIRPAGSTEFINYTGDRSLASFQEWISKNAKNDLTLPEKPAAKETAQATATETPAATQPAEGHEHDEL